MSARCRSCSPSAIRERRFPAVVVVGIVAMRAAYLLPHENAQSWVTLKRYTHPRPEYVPEKST